MSALYDDIKAAAEARAALAAAEARIAERVNRPQSEADHARMVEHQVRADSAYREHARQAPMPVPGETPIQYRRRLAAGMQHNSADWRGVELGHMPEKMLTIAERDIYRDALVEARNPKTVPAGTLRAITRRDASGRETTEFFGDPEVTWGPFKLDPLRATFIEPRRK